MTVLMWLSLTPLAIALLALVIHYLSPGPFGENVSMLIIPAGVAAAFFAVFWGIGLLLQAECDRIGVQVERETEFYFPGGCFVTLDNGRSVPIDENSIGLFIELLEEDR